ncbi:uncharacterized protein CMU_029050 [Cryptosporidium muris RN66]|uniref:Uncharacterized protein n=1 Tax=Cryptosporidium muris (strain RN66) TaxID=441375 RepID=B6AHZ0_CRYMR|nr:uncharacterized protein CMU_029050 [Cryptosporidium muris RN66]EEA07831.1 hypothetical protein CMU_029050 [Cryptosporidium muris RN66]|eukprot:XP_002142180.1 hypothetical protein [Cryptosporidium muris RN66]
MNINSHLIDLEFVHDNVSIDEIYKFCNLIFHKKEDNINNIIEIKNSGEGIELPRNKSTHITPYLSNQHISQSSTRKIKEDQYNENMKLANNNINDNTNGLNAMIDAVKRAKKSVMLLQNEL